MRPHSFARDGTNHLTETPEAPMTPEEPSPEETRLHPPPAGMEELDPAELLARGLDTVQRSPGANVWLPPSPEELARLLPQYRIESLIGHGGMGAVYKG